MTQIDWVNATFVLTPDTFGAAIIAGVIIGAVYLSQIRGAAALVAPFSLLVCGEGFLIGMVAARFLDGADVWERTFGYVVLWPVFCSATWVGIKFGYKLAHYYPTRFSK